MKTKTLIVGSEDYYKIRKQKEELHYERMHEEGSEFA